MVFSSQENPSVERESFSVREGGCKFSIENILGSLVSPPPPHPLQHSHHSNKEVTYTDISEDELDVDEDDSDEESSNLR